MMDHSGIQFLIEVGLSGLIAPGGNGVAQRLELPFFIVIRRNQLFEQCIDLSMPLLQRHRLSQALRPGLQIVEQALQLAERNVIGIAHDHLRSRVVAEQRHIIIHHISRQQAIDALLPGIQRIIGKAEAALVRAVGGPVDMAGFDPVADILQRRFIQRIGALQRRQFEPAQHFADAEAARRQLDPVHDRLQQGRAGGAVVI